MQFGRLGSFFVRKCIRLPLLASDRFSWSRVKTLDRSYWQSHTCKYIFQIKSNTLKHICLEWYVLLQWRPAPTMTRLFNCFNLLDPASWVGMYLCPTPLCQISSKALMKCVKHQIKRVNGRSNETSWLNSMCDLLRLIMRPIVSTSLPMFASISPSHLSQGDGQPDREHKEINVLPIPQGRLEGDKVFAYNETFRSSQVISGHVFISSLVCIGPVYAMVHMLLRYYKQDVPPPWFCIIQND